jgi:tol-pal system protein YbgF
VTKARQQLVLLCTLPAMLLAGSVFGQSTRTRITTLEQQVITLERLLRNNQDTQTETLGRLEDLQLENQQLRNELETLQFESKRSADRARELYIDLDQRLVALSATAVAGGAASSNGAAKLSDADAYQAAFEFLKQGQYSKAGDGFTDFLADYPDSDLRDNAQYWLAESRYVNKDFAMALAQFQNVINQYPASRKIPDAWLKIGYCQYELEQWPTARTALTTVTSQYPDSTAAKLAAERLALMEREGV